MLEIVTNHVKTELLVSMVNLAVGWNRIVAVYQGKKAKLNLKVVLISGIVCNPINCSNLI